MNAERLLALYEKVAEAPDAVPRLRRFVLDLAVRGKLVPQEAGDEPASELLKRIAAEKARLVKAGEIRKPKTFSLADDVSAEIPANWALVPLGTVILQHLGGGTPSKSNESYWNGDLRWASVKDVGKSKYLDDTIDRITQAGLANSSSNLIEPGNLLVVTRMGLGKVSINRVPVAINQDLRALFLSQHVGIDYAYNFFLTHGFEGTGLTVKGIKLEELLCIPFPLPPLAEQRRIVGKVEELMALLDRLEAARTAREATRDRLTAASLARLTAPDTAASSEKVGTGFSSDEATNRNTADFLANAHFALATLPALTNRPDQIKPLRQTILNLAVRGNLVDQDPTDEPASELLKRIAIDIADYIRANGLRGAKGEKVSEDGAPFALPCGWVWTRLASLCRVVTDGDHQPPPRAETGVAFLTIGNVTTGSLNFAGCRRVPPEYFAGLPGYRTPAQGDLLYTVVGATFGRPVLVESEEPFCVQRHIAILKPSAEAFVTYLHRVLASPFVYEQAAAATTGAAQPTVALKPLRNFLIPLPPLAEQHRIVAKVDALMALCDRLEVGLTTADTTRVRLLKALLQEALAPAGDRKREAAE